MITPPPRSSTSVQIYAVLHERQHSFEGTATLAGNSFDLSGGINDPAGVALEFFGTAMLPSMNDSSALATAPFRAFGWFSLPSGDQALMRGALSNTLRTQIVPMYISRHVHQ